MVLSDDYFSYVDCTFGYPLRKYLFMYFAHLNTVLSFLSSFFSILYIFALLRVGFSYFFMLSFDDQKFLNKLVKTVNQTTLKNTIYDYIKNISYLGINLMKSVKNLVSHNHKLLLIEILKDLNKWKANAMIIVT